MRILSAHLYHPTRRWLENYKQSLEEWNQRNEVGCSFGCLLVVAHPTFSVSILAACSPSLFGLNTPAGSTSRMAWLYVTTCSLSALHVRSSGCGALGACHTSGYSLLGSIHVLQFANGAPIGVNGRRRLKRMI